MGSDMVLAAQQGGSGAFNLLLLLAVPLVFYFLLIRPQSKRRREQMQMQSSLRPGARVVTTSGMYAEVVAVDDDGVELEIAPGVQARFVKAAIMQIVQEQDDDTGTGDEGDEGDGAEDTAGKADLTKHAGDDTSTETDAGSGTGTGAETDTVAGAKGETKGDETKGDDEGGDAKPAAQGAGAGKGLKK